MKKIETILDENQRRISTLEKENKDLEDKLNSVSFNLNTFFFLYLNILTSQ